VKEADSASLFKTIETFFLANDIPFERNMIGFASDGAAVMMGKHNSVSQKFCDRIPHLFIFRCICHSIDLAASEASRRLPSYLEETLLEIFYYLKYSTKRQLAVASLQKLLDIPEKKYLQLHKVRWLSLGAVVDRTLEQYDVLLRFFDEERKKCSNKEKAQRIFANLENPYSRLYYEFLSFILKLVCKKNLEFQTEAPKIHCLHLKMCSFFRTVVGMYLKDDYIERTDEEFIEYKERTTTNARNWEPLNAVDIGPTAKSGLLSLASATARDRELFIDRCRQFLIALADGIYSRFPFSSPQIQLLKNLNWIEPKEIKNTKNITPVAHFFGVDVEDAYREFKLLKVTFKDNSELDLRKFWEKVAQSVNGDSSLQFPLLINLVQRILILPHSSANVEAFV
jgi:hypothetical protein